MKLGDPNLEYLTTQGGKTLTIYDIAEINEAYQCTGAHCPAVFYLLLNSLQFCVFSNFSLCF